MIAVDIGNTYLHFFGFKNGEIFKSLRIPTLGVTKNKIKETLAKFLSGPVIVCSVVPGINHLFRGLKLKVYFVGSQIRVPIICQYKKTEVGSDRLVAAFAARTLFSQTRIVIDFGTAITFDFLSKNGHYQGGIILPGIGSTLSVFSSCALLPNHIKLKKTNRMIPRNTQESISKGLTEGFPAMINTLVKKYIKLLKISAEPTVVLTGGEAFGIKSALNFRYYYEPYLVAKGLYLLAAKYDFSQ
ncbi:MAG: type III pantothenate kinase [Candidatus Omnitrophica bacterium]|nr:type III pantothenate kinase [Candidatus Omnitrophota bacterium]